MKITAYVLLTANNVGDLSFQVNDHLRAEWELYGDPSTAIATDGDNNYYVNTQAMVKVQGKKAKLRY